MQHRLAFVLVAALVSVGGTTRVGNTVALANLGLVYPVNNRSSFVLDTKFGSNYWSAGISYGVHFRF